MTRKMHLTVKKTSVYGKDLEEDSWNLARADALLYQMEDLFDEIESDLNLKTQAL